MAAGPWDDILTNMAYYRNGFINVFMAPFKLQIVCELLCMDVYVELCIRRNACVQVWQSASVYVCVPCHWPAELLELESEKDNNR